MYKNLPPLMVLLHLFEISTQSPSGLVWRNSPGGPIKPGKTAGSFNGKYWNVRYDNKYYSCARIIFYMETGIDPINHHVDHSLHDSSKNTHLRLATCSQNNANRRKQKTSSGRTVSSKFKGVSWFKRDKKWKVTIRVNKKSIHLGVYESEIEAAVAYNKAAIKIFGQYACLNEITE